MVIFLQYHGFQNMLEVPTMQAPKTLFHVSSTTLELQTNEEKQYNIDINDLITSIGFVLCMGVLRGQWNNTEVIRERNIGVEFY